MTTTTESPATDAKSSATKIVPVKLNAQELAWLDTILKNDNTAGFENRGEVFRLLLHREYRRRHNLGKPAGIDWQSSARMGRPVKGNI